MQIIGMKNPGTSDVLYLASAEKPQPKSDEVLIRVHAAGVNRPDVLQREGLYPAPADASPILGLEVAGEIVALGEDVSEWKLGDKVCALVNGGGYAEYAAAPAAQCLPIPDNFTFVQAAALPETFFTVWHNLFQRAQLKAGETLLIHGGTSGIGTTAIQVTIAFGVKVFATAGSVEKCQAIEKLGAVAINYREQDFVAEIKSKTQGQGANVILDMVGGDYIQRNFSAAAKDGRIVNIAFLNGSKTELDLMPLMLKRLTLTGSTLRAQSAQVKAQIAQELKQQVWPLLNKQTNLPMIDSVFPLHHVAQAHERMESGKHIGKIILTVI
ncbi:NAD(P)H quinone oxidoreductase [Cellvibrio zantedeschiae]|uniref:NAD(P)H quinone oxidoreductase n=1 Tax=Cellvibrio zantedeschiae TaxID=1237077 RepID=A0ABQ3AWK9_9GAMM|nr:NAD(P)H-quinone oxidoreductase [Cellvibrio zantedeschiae]GGY66154.1 NAD(P)H quinone oxidoreductase [Cellvibrio zantedeschiae]